MEDEEAEIYDGIRAQFPLSFGKQTNQHTSLEAIHSATRRTVDSSSHSPANKGLPSLSSPSKAWLKDLRNPNPSSRHHGDAKPSSSAHENQRSEDRNSAFGKPSSTADNGSKGRVDGEDLKDDEVMVGPPQPTSNLADEDGVMIGPPRPPPSSNFADEDGEDDAMMIGPPRPPPGSNSADEDGESDTVMIGPPRPPLSSDLAKSDSDDDSDEEAEEDRYKIPLSNEIVLKGHTKVVSALAIDHSGSRVISGSYDYTVRMYDFQGMNSRLASFRQLEPFEGHQVRSLSWSPTADKFLCVTGSAQAKIYDRDGLTLGEFVKGDMYIRDLKNTKGHISGLTCGEWHPRMKETILTSSDDGSLRIWDVNDFKSQKQVLHVRSVSLLNISMVEISCKKQQYFHVGSISLLN